MQVVLGPHGEGEDISTSQPTDVRSPSQRQPDEPSEPYSG